MPKVSIILSAYNHEKFVGEAIQSVLDQTFRDLEFLIIDDGSSDHTPDVIRKFSDPRMKASFLSKNVGIVEARSRLFRDASGQYVSIFNSDDIYFPDKLSKQVEYLDNNPDVGAVFSLAEIIDDDGAQLTDMNLSLTSVFQQENRTRHQWLNQFFYRGNCLCHPSMLIRKKCYEKVGYYDKRFAQLLDFDMWIRLCMKYEIHIIQENLIKFRYHGDTSNASNRPESRCRDSFEYSKILKHFLGLRGKDEIIKIFPEVSSIINERYLIDTDIRKYVIAQLALKAKQNIHRVFAIETLYDLLGQRKVAEKLEKGAGFTYKDFIKLTGGS